MAFLARAAPLLNKLVPAGLGLKALSKLDPKMASFISNAGLAGFGSDAIIDYLRNRLAPTGEVSEKNRLEKGHQRGTLHPEQEASYNKRRDEDLIAKGIAGVAGLAGGLGGMGGQEEQEPPEGSLSPAVAAVPPPVPPTESEMRKKQAWEKYQEHLQKKKPPEEPSMKPGMKDAIIKQFESKYGPIPSDVRKQAGIATQTGNDDLTNAVRELREFVARRQGR